ncbi:hypothetical protein K491DRAFT_403481 [Lophiostoma macrostomum CBS 122681]|uniref:Uncharacterized protein n=1 Tax=Lophiostoma macrostomum CBS 122681 TaxID=1314788 RepID=A0A6A6T877_9PLEO|nr:hypothetical protein K491DRAFT_403481 [Lophiostoma macrostomum CBS 122681]
MGMLRDTKKPAFILYARFGDDGALIDGRHGSAVLFFVEKEVVKREQARDGRALYIYIYQFKISVQDLTRTLRLPSHSSMFPSCKHIPANPRLCSANALQAKAIRRVSFCVLEIVTRHCIHGHLHNTTRYALRHGPKAARLGITASKRPLARCCLSPRTFAC